MESDGVPSGFAAPAFAVENARNRSPDELPAKLPNRPSPRLTRRAMGSNWCGNSGALVATMTMIDPRPSCSARLPLSIAPRLDAGHGGMRAVQGRLNGCGSTVQVPRSVISEEIGTPRFRRSPPWLHWTKTPMVYPPCAGVNTRDAVPIPPLNPLQPIPEPPPTE